jgi:hypothetical protein
LRGRLEGWTTALTRSSFETHRFAMLLRMRPVFGPAATCLVGLRRMPRLGFAAGAIQLRRYDLLHRGRDGEQPAVGTVLADQHQPHGRIAAAMAR